MQLGGKSVIITRNVRLFGSHSTTNRMRGFDFMSASSKKKLRKEAAEAKLTERQLQEQAEAKKLKITSIAFVAVMVVVVLVGAAILLSNGVRNSGIIDRNTIAATIGDKELDSVQMNYYFTDQVRTQYQQWQSIYGDSLTTYLGMMGLDVNKALNKQSSGHEEGETWADHFLHDALDKAKSDYALYNKAIAENHKLTEDEQTEFDYNMEMLDFYAAYTGHKNANQYLKTVYGNGANVKSYKEYAEISAIAASYYTAHEDSLSYEDAAIRAYDKEHSKEYDSYSYAYYYLSSSSFLEGGTENENGTKTYSDEEKAAALKKAEEAANSVASAKDISAMDKAIAALEINKDKENVASTKKELDLYGNLPVVIQSWLSDSARKADDITALPNETTSVDADGKETKTVNGYYVVAFMSRNQNLEPLANVRHLLVQFEGGTTDKDGNKTYSDTEKAATKAEAERLLQVWKDGAATEESFIELVKEHTDDAGSKETGGLYEDIHPASGYVDSFKAWSLDVDRKPGDTGVIISDYGYHVMYYVADDALTYRDYMISETLRSTEMEEWYNGIVDPVTAATVKTDRMNLNMVISSLIG